MLLVVLLFPGRSCSPFTSWEKRVIQEQDSVLYVTTLWQDSSILRTPSADLSSAELRSALLKTLEAKMLRTVTDPSQDGVGIAAPHIVRRIFGTSVHKKVLPLSLAAGACLTLAGDILSQAGGTPLPVGSTLALIGIPLILVLLWRNRL